MLTRLFVGHQMLLGTAHQLLPKSVGEMRQPLVGPKICGQQADMPICQDLVRVLHPPQYSGTVIEFLQRH